LKAFIFREKIADKINNPKENKLLNYKNGRYDIIKPSSKIIDK
jgi:hypothetical protein